MAADNIRMSVDDVLELEYLVEEVTRDTIQVNSQNDSEVNYISKEVGVFDPKNTGEYEIDIGGDKILVDVYDIPDTALTEDMIAWYRFEDGDARDYASNSEYPDVTWGDSTAYDATVNGAMYRSDGGVTDFANSSNSGAFEFDGSDDYIDTTFTGSSSELTCTLWLYIDNYNNIDGTRYQPFSLRGCDGGGQFQFDVFPDGDVGYYWSDTSPRFTYDFPLQQYKHIALVGRSDSAELFIDGQSAFSSNSGGTNHTTCNNFQIGRDAAGAGEFVDGLMDDVRIYNRALKPSEVSGIYNSTKP